MFFRNLTLFRFPDGCIGSAEAFEATLAQHPLRDVGPLELSTTGFVSPMGRDGEAFTHAVGTCVLFAVGQQERMLPAVVIAEELAHRVDTIYEREGRRPGGRERKRIKEEVISELLPRAFVRPRRTLAYVDLAAGWLVIDTSSRAAAETVVSHVREALGSFPATPLGPVESPRTLMTSWLIDGALPAAFVLGEECELRDPAEAGAIVRARRQDLESDEVREHLKSGKQVFQLGVVYDDRMSLTLGEDLVVRKLRFLDVVLDKLGEDSMESKAAELEATFALMILELRVLFERMAELFGIGRDPALRLDGGDAPKHMRDAERIRRNTAPRKRGRDEKAVRITAELYTMRDRARTLLGDKFPEHMREYGALIAAHAKKHGVSELAAAWALAAEQDAPDTWPVVILAAAVEMIEPSAAPKEPTEGS